MRGYDFVVRPLHFGCKMRTSKLMLQVYGFRAFVVRGLGGPRGFEFRAAEPNAAPTTPLSFKSKP